ncbi:MAG: threonine--tRNA ligase [Bacilli bacterium]|nr:threonine--tRNA ligase [Bacilli bacterium]
MEITKDILNHSTAHLLAHAIHRLYPKALFAIGPSIEEGFYYDIDFNDVVLTENDFAKIEAEMKKIVKENIKIVRKEISKDEALKLFKDNPYKIELIKELKDDEKISIYEQGDFTDLCRGPHVGYTGNLKHFKLLSLAGAYWRGDSKNKQLTRIYGTSAKTKEELDAYLKLLEDRKARDHRKLGKELGLFMISEFGPGFPFWLPRGMILRNELENYWYERHTEEGYVFVRTPIMLSKELWITSGHWTNYKDNMYTSKIEDKEFAIKPMNCPGGMLIYKNVLHSYKDLPIRMGELGLVHRNEASGALAGLFRVRTFTQDDAHIFCRKDQLQDEIKKMLKLYDEMYSLFNLDYTIELSTRPENKYIGDIKIWNESEKILEEAIKASGKQYKINKGDGAFYGPKLDFKIRDSMNRIWQCGTIQLDMNLPERFDLTYVDENNNKVRPIMLHRALFGSIERFIGILIEHYGGAFPVWLCPEQVRVLPVNNQFHLQHAKHVVEEMKKLHIRAKLDDSNEKLGYRLRNAQVMKVPYTVVIGDKERDNKTLTYRKFGEQAQTTVKQDEFIKLVLDTIKDKKKV